MSTGPVAWDKVTLPPGRTRKACTHIIDQLQKSTKAGDSATPVKAVPSKADGSTGKGKGTGTKKRTTADASENDDEEGKPGAIKKVKTIKEIKEEDEAEDTA